MTLFPRLIELLKERDAEDILVFGGGIIPDEDIPVLEEIGVAKVFTPGATTGEITGWVADGLRRARLRPAASRGRRRARSAPADRSAAPRGTASAAR